MQEPVTCCALQTNFTKSQVLDSRAAPTVCPVQDNIQLPDQPLTDDSYGFSLAASKDASVFAVGTPEYKITVSGEQRKVGAVFIYDLSNAKYILKQVILHPLLQDGASFGRKIEISANGRTIVVSAPEENEERGAVYVYERKNCEKCFTESEKLVFSELEEKNRFGNFLALSSDGSVCMIATFAQVEIFVKTSKNSKFESAEILDFGLDIADAATKIIGKKVALRGPSSLSLSENGKLAVIGMPTAEVEQVATGGVLVFERSACKNKWIFVDFLADQPKNRTQSRIGEDVVITPSGKDLIVFSGASQDPNPSADFAFTVVYSLKNKYFQKTQFIEPSNTQISSNETGLSYVDISDNGCFLTIAYACSDDAKGEIEIFSRRNNQQLFSNFQRISDANLQKFGIESKLSGSGKALFATNLFLIDEKPGEVLYQVTVRNSKNFF
jgi:hypothetical protein